MCNSTNTTTCELNEMAENAKLLDINNELKARIRCQDLQIERLKGEIEGLRFAVRCNGVSGGEVR